VNPAGYLDTLGLWEATAAIPERMSAALDSLRHVHAGDLMRDVDRARAVVVLGVGASGTVADAVSACAASGGRGSRVPVVAVSGPTVPAWVGPGVLVFAVSTSGQSTETLAATEAALSAGASVVGVSSGGHLRALVESAGGPHLLLADHGPVTHVALTSALALVLGALSELGLVPDTRASMQAAIPTLQRRSDALVAAPSPADELARRIGRTIPLVYGAAGLAGVAAQHWKRQFNENVKTPAFWGVVPEVAHAEVSGWGQHGDITRQVLTLIALRHYGEPTLVATRYDAVLEAVDEVMADVLQVWAEGANDLERFLDLVVLGNFVALHLAGREGIDPGPLAFQPAGG
jgi:glucose/mannose-6-phosphate isomerase